MDSQMDRFNLLRLQSAKNRSYLPSWASHTRRVDVCNIEQNLLRNLQHSSLRVTTLYCRPPSLIYSSQTSFRVILIIRDPPKLFLRFTIYLARACQYNTLIWLKTNITTQRNKPINNQEILSFKEDYKKVRTRETRWFIYGSKSNHAFKYDPGRIIKREKRLEVTTSTMLDVKQEYIPPPQKQYVVLPRHRPSSSTNRPTMRKRKLESSVKNTMKVSW